jgi:hypothetical protein
MVVDLSIKSGNVAEEVHVARAGGDGHVKLTPCVIGPWGSEPQSDSVQTSQI